MKYQKHYWSICLEKVSLIINNDAVGNVYIGDYRTTVNNPRYDLKNQKKILLEIITKKISENETSELYKPFDKIRRWYVNEINKFRWKYFKCSK